MSEPSRRGESLPSSIMAVAMPHPILVQFPFVLPCCLFASYLGPLKAFPSPSFE